MNKTGSNYCKIETDFILLSTLMSIYIDIWVCGQNWNPLNWNVKDFDLQGLLEGPNLVSFGKKPMLRLDSSN